jgi:hypothetical protein
MQELNDLQKILNDSGMKLVSKEIFDKAFSQKQHIIKAKSKASNLLLLASMVLFLFSSGLSFCTVIYVRGILPEEKYQSNFDNYKTPGWYLNGVLHREKGPAIEQSDGTKEWYLSGVRHRVDGPAIEWSNGTKEWYLNGLRW